MPCQCALEERQGSFSHHLHPLFMFKQRAGSDEVLLFIPKKAVYSIAKPNGISVKLPPYDFHGFLGGSG